MKDITNFFTKKQIIFSSFESILPKELKSRKKIEIYNALSIKNKYYAIFKVDLKSRFLMKNAKELQELLDKLILYKDHNFKYKILIISSDVCSESKDFLKKLGWTIYKA
jgi:hypothetical protein